MFHLGGGRRRRRRENPEGRNGKEKGKTKKSSDVKSLVSCKEQYWRGEGRRRRNKTFSCPLKMIISQRCGRARTNSSRAGDGRDNTSKILNGTEWRAPGERTGGGRRRAPSHSVENHTITPVALTRGYHREEAGRREAGTRAGHRREKRAPLCSSWLLSVRLFSPKIS